MKVQIVLEQPEYISDDGVREDLEDILHDAGYSVHEVVFIHES